MSGNCDECEHKRSMLGHHAQALLKRWPRPRFTHARALSAGGVEAKWKRSGLLYQDLTLSFTSQRTWLRTADGKAGKMVESWRLQRKTKKQWPQ